MMEGLKVRCHTCGMVLYETTDKYTCHKPLSGDMLRLLPLYKDWPTYDGSLAVSSTSRFLMFCSQCAGYVATPVGGLRFADFYEEPHVVSKERSDMPWWDSPVEHGEPIDNLTLPYAANDSALSSLITSHFPLSDDPIDNLILPYAEDSVLSDDLQKAETPTVSPEDLIKEIEKQGNTSRKKKRK